MRNSSLPARDVVGWGCGEFFLALRAMQSFPLKYIVHTDQNLWGSRILGTEIKGPDALAAEDPARVVVFAYSQEYETAIREQTARIGPFHVYCYRDPEFYDPRYGPLRNFFAKTAGQSPLPPAQPLADGAIPSAEALRRAYDDERIRRSLEAAGIDTVEHLADPDRLCARATEALRGGALLGWFQGRDDRAILAAADADTAGLALHGDFTPLAAGDGGDLLERLRALWGERAALRRAPFTPRGLPPVDSPEDAIRAFSWSGLDTLVMGPFVIRKEFF